MHACMSVGTRGSPQPSRTIIGDGMKKHVTYIIRGLTFNIYTHLKFLIFANIVFTVSGNLDTFKITNERPKGYMLSGVIESTMLN